MNVEMSRYLVLAVDAVRARFFRLQDTDTPEIESGPNLVETGDMLNPENEMQGEAIFTETKTGANISSANGKMHQYDDHRMRHREEFAKRFGADVVHEAIRRARPKETSDLILVANPTMLGLIRGDAEQQSKEKNINVHAVAKDVSKMSARQIHELLAGKELLPPRRAAAGQMGARRRRA